ncbi:hypothetical protein QIS74_12713 [Colletotrichum tabaci]|uniref:Uncharacterized protein n=1 Tax=Colletotrichum tabaci TaxID=1209068 RepID=A0AAV9SUT5_9PEZI
MLSINYRPGPGAAAVKDNPSRRGRLWDSFIELRLHEKEDKFRLRFELSISNSEVMQVDLRTRPSPVSFKLFADADSPLAASVPGRPALWDTSSEAAYSFLSRCISECDSNHTCTQPLSDISFPCKPPRRLIKIDDGDAGLHLKLIQTSSLAEFPRYCALSYCWDNPARHAQKKPLRSTLGTYESVINPTGLPRTVADADGDDDKLSEIAAMGDIYANPYLTLTPFIAGGSDDGFLAPRENPFLSPPIPDIRSGGAPVDVKLVPSSRGLLNPSTLKARAAGEPSPREYITAMELRELFPSLSLADSEPDGDLGYRWPWVAEHCSSRILSVLGDKALAIHAIKYSHRDGNRTYDAGVWLRNIKVGAPAIRRHPRTPFEIDRFRRHTTAAAPPRSPLGPDCHLTAVSAST